jgi:penicillin amidase
VTRLFEELPEPVLLSSDAAASHVWDASVIDNLALRVLAPSTSSLTPSRDYAGGRSADDVLLSAVADAAAQLVADHGEDPAGWRDQHPRRDVESLSGVIGPSLTMPYQDRGTWVHVVAFDGPAAAAAAPSPASAPGRAVAAARLPATGTEAVLVWSARRCCWEVCS